MREKKKIVEREEEIEREKRKREKKRIIEREKILKENERERRRERKREKRLDESGDPLCSLLDVKNKCKDILKKDEYRRLENAGKREKKRMKGREEMERQRIKVCKRKGKR